MTIRSPLRSNLLKGCALCCLLLLGQSLPVLASPSALPVEENVTRQADPDDLSILQERQKTSGEDGRSKKKQTAFEQEEEVALRIRQDSMKEAARSYGARGGLAWRTHQIMVQLDENGPALDKTF
ncbi:MAG TPA: type IV secretory system conjugative DNA transfer family protein, partial [Alphaproteobacteria bacterium]